MSDDPDLDRLDDLLRELGGSTESSAEEAEAPPAWGGGRPGGSVPVPRPFEGVTELGPAVAVHRRSDSVLLPGFGAPKALVLYRDGFACQTRAKDPLLWRWDETAAIFSNSTMSSSEHGVPITHLSYTLVKRSGEKFVLDDALQDVDPLIAAIKRDVFARLMPPLQRQYAAGEAVAFGPVSVERRNGIRIRNRLNDWADVLEVRVERGRLRVELRDGKRHEMRASNIPNVDLLCRLIGVKLLEPMLTYY